MRLDSTTASMNFDPGHAVLHRGHQRRRRVRRAAVELGPDQLGGVAVEGGEALEVAFGMAGGDARHPARHGVGAGAAAADQLRRLAVGGEAAGSSDPPAPSSARPCRHRRGCAGRSRCRVPPGSPTACPLAPPAKRSMTWALSSSGAAGDEGGEVGAQAFQPQPGDEGGEVHGVGGDVAGAAGRARASRVGAPARLLLAGILELGRQPVLRVLGLDDPDACRAGRRPPSAGPAGPSGSRCNCGSARTRSPTSRPARPACARP